MLLESPRDAKLYVEQDMVEAETHLMTGGLAAVHSSRCPGKETPNEDAAALIPYDTTSGVLVVADGLGGVPAGERASGLTLKSLRTSIGEAARNGVLLRSAIIDGIEKANRQVLDLGFGAGTTLAVVEIQGQEIRPYHVGDSMILLTSVRGKVKLQTVSHSPIGYAVEAGVLDEEEAMHHEDRHLVSNVIGTAEMRIELGSTMKMATRDTLLLASDGLFDNLQVDEITDRLRKGPVRKAMHRLATDAQERMNHPVEGLPSKPDDLTFVAFRLERSK